LAPVAAAGKEQEEAPEQVRVAEVSAAAGELVLARVRAPVPG
jgi:hypothetical protein